MAVAGSVTLHTVAAGFFLTSTSTQVAMPPVYRVELVAAPRPEPDRRRAPETVQRQAEQTVPTPRPPRRTSQAETPPPPTREPEDREPAPRTDAVELAPDVEPSTGSDPATVSTAGVEFPFPEYLRNIVVQVHRRWQRPSGNVSLRAEVSFFIHREGGVTHFQFVQRSGNFGFDLEAQGAIEAAANSGAFGPLPEGFPDDVLFVSFFFDPATTR
jgi:outer membrane biosynthesis protein TonB